MFNKLKQFKDVRDEAKKLQNTLASEKVTIEKDGIVLVMNGNQEIVSLKIESSKTAEDIEKIMPKVFSDAIKQVQKIIAQKMRSGEFKMPNFG